MVTRGLKPRKEAHEHHRRGAQVQTHTATAASASARRPRTRTCSSVNQARPKSTPTGRAVARLGTERRDASRLRLQRSSPIKEESPDTPNHARANVRTYLGPIY